MEKTFKFTVYSGNIQEVDDVEGYHNFLIKNLPDFIELNWVEGVSGICSDGIAIDCDADWEECDGCKHKGMCGYEEDEYSELVWNAYCHEEPEKLKDIFSEFEDV